MKTKPLFLLTLLLSLLMLSCTSPQEKNIKALEEAERTNDLAAIDRLVEEMMLNASDYTPEQQQRILRILKEAADKEAAASRKSFRKAWDDGDVYLGMTYEQITDICSFSAEPHRKNGEIYHVYLPNEGINLWFRNGCLREWTN